MLLNERGRRLKQLLDDLKKTKRYWTLKEKILYRTLCTTRCGGGEEPAVRLRNDDVWNTALLIFL